MPNFEIRGVFAIFSILLLAIVWFIASKRGHKPILYATSGTAFVLLVGILSTGEHWRRILNSGVFRLRNTALTSETVKTLGSDMDLLFYKDGPDATVSVAKGNDPVKFSQVFLRINGKTDASTFGDLSTQFLFAHLPMMAKPDAKQVFLLGFGSGITAGAILGHPVDKLTIAENCHPVLEAAPYFSDWNRGVLTNNRTVIRNDDAPTAKLSPQKYSLVPCEPSNPWVAGVGSVFSRDFYELAAAKLSEGGIMAQWFHCYEMDDAIVFLVVRTFSAVFPNMEIWDTQNGDIVLLGSAKPWKFSLPELRKYLSALSPGPTWKKFT